MIDSSKQSDFRMYKTAIGGKKGFIDLNDPAALEQLRNDCHNSGIFISICSYDSPDLSSKCHYPLYVVISGNVNDARNSAIESFYRLMEEISIAEKQIEIYYNPAAGTLNRGGDNVNYPAEIMLYISPCIFSNTSTEYMPFIGFNLARQITKDGTKNILIDIYERNYQINLPNSIVDTSGHYFVPLTFKELTFLNNEQLKELSTKPCPEFSYSKIEHNPTVENWLNQKNNELILEIKKQNSLLELVLKNGWQVPSCIQKLQSLCLYDNFRLETYRIITAFYAWIKASPQQIAYQIQSVDYKNPLNDNKKIKSIISFAIENPRFVGCQHPLLARFCPAGKCFMFDLIKELEKPYLFNR